MVKNHQNKQYLHEFCLNKMSRQENVSKLKGTVFYEHM
jgi:hypothetical protein